MQFYITASSELTFCKLIYYVLLTKAPSTQDRVGDAVSLHELEVEMLVAEQNAAGIVHVVETGCTLGSKDLEFERRGFVSLGLVTH